MRRQPLLLGLIPITLLLLACAGGLATGDGLVATRSARWACPSPTPLPYGEAGPVKARERCNCSTDPVSGEETCDECPIYFEEWEQEYGELGGPPFPAPTPYGRTGTSFRLGERVEVAPLHVLVDAEAETLVERPGVAAGTQQLYRISLEWTNPTSASIPIDYGTQLRLGSVTGADGRVRTDTNWGSSAVAREIAGVEEPPEAIPPGTSRVAVPIIAPPGRPKSVALQLPTGAAGPASGDPFAVAGPPTVTADQIDAILASEGSPAAGTGQLWYDIGVRYGIDPVFALAFYKKESSMGQDRVHQRPGGGNSHNIGNIICTDGWGDCVCTRTHCFRAYPSWAAGIEDWFRLMRSRYVDQGLLTLDEILPVYAPSFENDTQLYIRQTKQRVSAWRGEATGSGDLAQDSPQLLTIQWTAGDLAGPSCADPGALTDWASGQGDPIAVAAPPGAARVVQVALGQVGKPYVWGAKGPNAFDCSGLCTWSYGQIGVPIPQGTAGQWPGMRSVSQAEIQAGDLVFMDTSEPFQGAVTHVMLLVGDVNGNGQWDVVHAASPALGVRIDYDIFSSPYYGPRILGFRTAR
jgi:cell wall-associated NlpC family hydrolase